MRISRIDAFKNFIADKPDHQCKCKKQYGIYKHGKRPGLRIFKPNHKREHHNADNIINNGCT